MAAVDALAGGPPVVPVRLGVELGRHYRLSVLDLGLACCAVELVAATVAAAAAGAAVPLAGGPREADVLVVSGTVTDALAPAVLAVWRSLPEPRRVLSVGSCANSGGPYWDSYCVTKGVDQLVPVDVYVPGCPPRPEALLDGLLRLQELLDADRRPAPAAVPGSDAAALLPLAPVPGPADLRRPLVPGDGAA